MVSVNATRLSRTISMGKKSGTSWLTVVKRAFRSPTKGNDKSSRRREEHEQEEEEKKREKRRWPFRRANNDHAKQCEAKPVTNANTTPVIPILAAEQRHAIAVAAATAAAAEAAVATAQAAVEIVRLTTPPSRFVKEHYATVVIQTAFRGYLARRALRALKGIVMLQALVRGQNVRKQAKLTLKYMQAVVRAQDRVRDQRARLSHEESRKSIFAEINCLWESSNLQDIKNRKSISKSASGTIDEWEDRPHSGQGIDGMFQNRKEAALKREKALAYAFSNQIWRSRRNPSTGDENDAEERTKWLDRWMASRQWDNSTTRPSTDNRDRIKTVEIDMSWPCSYSAPTLQKSQSQNYHQKQVRPHSIASPLHRAQQSVSPHQIQSPATPSPRKTKPLQVRSASPRCMKEERCFSAVQTPILSSTYCINGGISQCAIGAAAISTLPNYMAATESAKARARSQSAPRQRQSNSQRERSGSVKKRLSYPAPEGTECSTPSQNLGSISFKSLHGGYYGMEQLSNYSSCYTESFGGEISPSLSGSRFSLNLWE